MHILFLTDNFPPETNAPATRLHEHAREWVREGHRVRVITCVPNFPEGRVFDGWENRWVQVEERDGIEIVRVKTFDRFGLECFVVKFFPSLFLLHGLFWSKLNFDTLF